MPEYARGRVVRMVVDRGFGFIRQDGGKREYFFHRKDCLPDCPFPELEPEGRTSQGTHVQFQVEQDEQGRWRAVSVELV